jgi:hypothetical protein
MCGALEATASRLSISWSWKLPLDGGGPLRRHVCSFSATRDDHLMRSFEVIVPLRYDRDLRLPVVHSNCIAVQLPSHTAGGVQASPAGSFWNLLRRPFWYQHNVLESTSSSMLCDLSCHSNVYDITPLLSISFCFSDPTSNTKTSTPRASKRIRDHDKRQAT